MQAADEHGRQASDWEGQAAARPDRADVSRDAWDVGDTLGPYKLLRRIGAGTTGTVFEVEHQRIARRAALKVLSPIAAVPNICDRFVVEAQAVNAIKNAHVVEITDILEAPDGRPFGLVMELLEGQSLGDLLRTTDRLPTSRALRILAHVCEGLAAVHAAGFVHRDLKPENVFLVQRGDDADFAKLLDFGLVKLCTQDGRRGGCGTVEGTFLGSPAYASPEQAAGQPVDQRTDIYSLGVMAYELVTGELPFLADGFREVLMKHMTAPLPHLPPEMLASALGRGLDQILQTCLAKEPVNRLFSGHHLAEMFRRLAETGDAGPLARAAGRSSGRLRRWRWSAVAGPIALAALGLLLLARHHAGAPPKNAVTPALSAAAEVTPPLAPTSAAPAHGDDGDEGRELPKQAGRARRAGTVHPLTEATTLNPFR